MELSESFRVGVTRDFLDAEGNLGFGDIGLGILDDAEGVAWEFLKDDSREIRPEVAGQYDALLVLAPSVTAASLERAERLKLIARFGVGYDNVDVEACSQQGVLLTITPEGVRRPVATSAIALLLALSHKLLVKDRLTREGRWGEKINHMGRGLTGRTLGVAGLGNIGREVLRLAAPFELRHVAYDPHVRPETVGDLDVELVGLEELLTTSDFVVICCALAPETRHLINAERLALLKSTASLINVARGPVVDQQALTEALAKRSIASAALDVFETEPVDPEDPILKLDNVIVAPHAISWTDELFSGIGRDACQSIVEVASGRVPRSVVNCDLLDQPHLRAKLNQPS